MSHRRTLALAPVAALALATAAPATAQTPGLIPTVSKLRTNGIGKVKVGMTVKQARKAAGVHRYELVWKVKRGRLIFTIVGGKVSMMAGGTAPWALQQECV
jgi:hypothetical protein